MKTHGAVLRGPGDWEVAELELVDPGPGQVLVEMAYAGLCHSDEHLRFESQRYPIVGGHEGAGVVQAVGAGVTGVQPGDHVVTSFLPACGHCRWCATGRSNLCDLGATIGTGQLPDGTWPFRLDGEELGGFCMVGAFAQHSVLSQFSCVKIEPHLPLDVAALMACSVPTGWGSAVNAGPVRQGDVVVVVGTGGVGCNAVQGAAMAGAGAVVAVDPVAFRREFAQTLGATHAVASTEEAAGLAKQLSRGTGADVVILATGTTSPEITGGAYRCLGKGGTLVLTGLADHTMATTVALPGNITTVYEQRVQGALYGMCNAYRDIPRLLRLYEDGALEVDSLITKRYSLDEVNQGYQDQRDGTVIRGVLQHQH
ncbi:MULTISPECIES: NDMA-dependent alcohol dehydrogenase [unclassified Modestobacter]|uniref:NDMA-dependent alcohol dehydrogenase n=1 Tax=unclassified Modestobacter TaxID=2643866 RepID=UPI0022AA33E9|nr:MULTISPECIES: NDMA-dependent alcohol dehydrogenase [unclassified Modestobacter]MCZ2813379.1 NDMA-dependent alcohol dehydrogenase [Modestobacter sp. VKM Ac-2979]MCZ2842429.1 NDMA-dependent alcohol dehydrogenase [Modestobacter sp. VKM Ac-2980]MCZ2846539.1 NDMA-dependent alcohol dehydrogenase [Modestobacter sp. VKM Ac-2978]